MLLMAHKKLSSDSERSIAEAYASGGSLESLARTYQCSAGTIRNTLLRMGVARRGPGFGASPISPTKTCSSCARDLDRSEFYGRGKRTSECKTCWSEKASDKYASDAKFRASKLEIANRRRSSNPGKHTAYVRLKKTGWSPDRFNEAWTAQEGKCAICTISMVMGGTLSNSVCADHDHGSGKPRALLCGKCNKHLGVYEKYRESFEEYLKTYGGLSV